MTLNFLTSKSKAILILLEMFVRIKWDEKWNVLLFQPNFSDELKLGYLHVVNAF